MGDTTTILCFLASWKNRRGATLLSKRASDVFTEGFEVLLDNVWAPRSLYACPFKRPNASAVLMPKLSYIGTGPPSSGTPAGSGRPVQLLWGPSPKSKPRKDDPRTPDPTSGSPQRPEKSAYKREEPFLHLILPCATLQTVGHDLVWRTMSSAPTGGYFILILDVSFMWHDSMPSVCVA